MSKDLDAIIQFIQQPNTDYAFMLTGPWGSGKTCFWNNIVVPHLRQISDPTNQPLIAYISLYGIQRTEALRNAVLAQLHPRIAKAGKLANVLGPAFLKMLRMELPKSESFLEWCETWWRGDKETRSIIKWLMNKQGEGKQLIICFDDLERASLPISVLLGQINQFVEHAGAKIVILCNEKEIRDTNYKKTKEKVVRITRAYSGDPVRVLPAIIAEFSNDNRYHEFLNENRNSIAEVLRQSGLKNLRTLKYSLLVLQVAFTELSKLLLNGKAIYEQYLKILLPVSFDLQEGKISKAHATSLLTQGSGAIFGAQLIEKDKHSNPLTAFGDRYGFGGFHNILPTSDALADLIETGYLDPEKLRAEIDERNATQTTGQKAANALLGGWFELPDNLINSNVTAALDAVRTGEITSPDRLHNLANVLDWMSSKDVPGIAGGIALLAFEDGIAKMTKDWKIDEHELSRIELSSHSLENERALGKQVRILLSVSNAEFKDRKLKEEFNSALKGIATDSNRFSFLFWDESEKGIGRRPIASFINPQTLAEVLFSTSNEVRYAISLAFRRRYSESHNIEALREDLPWLQDFHNLIQHHLTSASETTPIENLNLRWIQDHAQTAISRIQQLSQTALNPPPKSANEPRP